MGGAWAIGAANGGGGSAGSAIIVWLYIDGYNDIDYHEIGKCYCGKAGEVPEGEGKVWPQTVYWGGHWWFPNFGGGAGGGETSYLNLNVGNYTYHFDAKGGANRYNSFDASSTTVPVAWKSSIGQTTQVGSNLAKGDTASDSHIAFRLIALVNGGYGGAKISKGGECSLTLSESELPCIVKNRTASWSETQPDHSADLADPVAPGWGGCALLGGGGYAKMTGSNSYGIYHPSYFGYGGGGVGTQLTNFWASNGGPVPAGGEAGFRSGTNGAQGDIQLRY